MANECNTSDSPEAQAQRAKSRAEEAKTEQRLLEKFDELKAVSQAHAIISDNYFNAMLDNIKNSEKEMRVQDEEDDRNQIKTLMGIDRIGDVASRHYHSLLSIDNNLNLISSSLKTFLSNTFKTTSKVESANREISENRDNLNKSLHTNRNDLMVDLWSAQTSQLTSINSVLSTHANTNEKLLKGFVSNITQPIQTNKNDLISDSLSNQTSQLSNIHSVLSNNANTNEKLLKGFVSNINQPLQTNQNDMISDSLSNQTSQLSNIHSVLSTHANTNEKLLKGFVSNISKTIPEKSTITQNRREQQKRDLFLQAEREKDRSILLGIHRLLEKMKLGGGGATARGGGGVGGLGSIGLGAMLMAGVGKFWKWIKAGFSTVIKMLIGGATFVKNAFINVFKGIGGVLGKIGSKLKIVFGRLGTFLKGIFVGMRNFLGKTATFVKNGFVNTFKGIGGFLGKIGGKLKIVFGRLGGFLKGAFAGIKGLLVRFAPMLAKVGLGAMTALKGIGVKAVAMMGPAAAVAAAAAGGWAIGTWLDKKFGISDKIAEWLSGPNASEIAAQKLEEKSFKKQSEANISKQSLIKQAVVSTGLDEKVIKSMMSGMNNEQFDKLSKEQQDLIIKAQQESARMTAQLMARTAKDARLALENAGKFISKSERLNIEKKDRATTKVTQSLVKKSKTAKMLRVRQQQQIQATKERQEKQSIQINVQTRDKQKVMDSKKQSIEKANVELKENISTDTKINEKVVSLEDKRMQEKSDIRNDNMSNNLSKIAKHTEEALKKKNTYIVNPADQPGVTTSVGSMVKAGGR